MESASVCVPESGSDGVTEGDRQSDGEVRVQHQTVQGEPHQSSSSNKQDQDDRANRLRYSPEKDGAIKIGTSSATDEARRDDSQADGYRPGRPKRRRQSLQNRGTTSPEGGESSRKGTDADGDRPTGPERSDQPPNGNNWRRRPEAGEPGRKGPVDDGERPDGPDQSGAPPEGRRGTPEEKPGARRTAGAEPTSTGPYDNDNRQDQGSSGHSAKGQRDESRGICVAGQGYPRAPHRDHQRVGVDGANRSQDIGRSHGKNKGKPGAKTEKDPTAMAGKRRRKVVAHHIEPWQLCDGSRIILHADFRVQQHLLTLIPGYSTEFGAAAYGRPRPRTKTRGTKSLAVEDGN
ncbi:translation initiation factor IF-2-like [Drosophila santomea]|uniref:translation initiation factor IF-2-like n=1 Tax=Drosophila santomea TaxID=129105 RepID=UPI001CCB1B02|nr:translation initiation factor IF-2-like [Drosophila santomea]